MWPNFKNTRRKGGFQRADIYLTLFVEIASAVEQLVLRVGLYFVKEDATSSDKSIIHEIKIPKHLS